MSARDAFSFNPGVALLLALSCASCGTGPFVVESTFPRGWAAGDALADKNGCPDLRGEYREIASASDAGVSPRRLPDIIGSEMLSSNLSWIEPGKPRTATVTFSMRADELIIVLDPPDQDTWNLEPFIGKRPRTADIPWSLRSSYSLKHFLDSESHGSFTCDIDNAGPALALGTMLGGDAATRSTKPGNMYGTRVLLRKTRDGSLIVQLRRYAAPAGFSLERPKVDDHFLLFANVTSARNVRGRVFP